MPLAEEDRWSVTRGSSCQRTDAQERGTGRVEEVKGTGRMGSCGVSPGARDVTSGRCVRRELKARARRRFWRGEDVGESEADRDEPEGGRGRRDLDWDTGSSGRVERPKVT